MEGEMVSIIIPCYNQGTFLEETLKCVQDQTYHNWECIVVNDGSTDTTENVALNWCSKNPRFKYINKSNEGLSSARNSGLKIASGSYIQFLDSDDYIEKHKLEASICYFNCNPNCDIVISNFETCNELLTERNQPYCDLKGHIFTFESILLDWDKQFTIPIHCGIFKFQLFKHFLFNEQLKAKEDWLMWLHIFKETHSYHFIDKPYSVYRNQVNGMTKNYPLMIENTTAVFSYIMTQVIEEKHRIKFFIKVNTYWHDQVESLLLQKKIIERSRAYRLSNFLLLPFKYLKNILSSLS